MSDGVTVERIRVRYGETDMMGHAYYANYLFWFEQARGAWCRDRGFTYKELEESGYRLPVVEVKVRYRDQVLYDDLISVHVRLTSLKRSLLTFEYEVFNETTGALCTTGSTLHVLVDSSMKPARPPEKLRELLGQP